MTEKTKKSSITRRVLSGIIISLISILLTLLIVEISLWLLRPDLGELVHDKQIRNRNRIHANPKNFTYQKAHPDTQEKHWVRTNSLGNRQHREFAAPKPPDTIRIGVFGDSFTENIRIPVQYSFTEPLDYLLNQTGKSYEVINFGTDGYGTDQVYLQYIDEGQPLDLDVVVYVYYRNDLIDILTDKLIDLDENGNLRYLPAPKPRFYINVIRRFYLTYFILERFASLDIFHLDFEPVNENKLMTKDEENVRRDKLINEMITQRKIRSHPQLDKAQRIFAALNKAMKENAENKNGHYFVVLVPADEPIYSERIAEHNKRISALLKEEGVETLDFYPIFNSSAYKDYQINDPAASCEVCKTLIPNLQIVRAERYGKFACRFSSGS